MQPVTSSLACSFDDLAQVLPSWKQCSAYCLLQSWNGSEDEKRAQLQVALSFLLFVLLLCVLRASKSVRLEETCKSSKGNGLDFKSPLCSLWEMERYGHRAELGFVFCDLGRSELHTVASSLTAGAGWNTSHDVLLNVSAGIKPVSGGI